MNLPNNKKLKNENGFGLTENILSASLLIFLVSFSMYFISLRQRTTYNTNLTNAINDEIYRDIEIIKSELKNYKVNSSQNENISIIRNNNEDCSEDILSAIRNLNKKRRPCPHTQNWLFTCPKLETTKPILYHKPLFGKNPRNAPSIDPNFRRASANNWSGCQ